MNNKIIWAVVAVLIVGGVAYYALRTPMTEPAAHGTSTSGTTSGQNNDGTVSSNLDEGAVQAVVSAFGKAMRNVSITAATSTAGASFDANYGSLITPELLQQWKAEPSSALGRATSNPWPESINIVTVTANPGGSYAVQGNVVEVTTANPNEVAGVYPVTLVLEKRDTSWRIASAVKGAYSTLPQRVTIAGTRTCLPHKDASGPQTMECALGIKASDGKNYGLNTTLLSSTDAINTINTAERLSVTGVLTPIENLNSDFWQRYDVTGILSVTGVESLD